MSGLPGAHILHQVTHTAALPGMLIGALIGAVAATAVIATGGLALVAVAGAGALAGGAIGAMIGGALEIKTGPIIPPCAMTVLYESMPAARVGDFVACTGIPFTPIPHPLSPIAQGSMTVFVENKPAARKGDMLGCSAKIAEGCSTVIIGGSTSQTYLSMTPEIPSLGDIANIIGNVLIGAAVAVGEFINDVANTVIDAINVAGEYISNVANTVVNAVEEFTSYVVSSAIDIGVSISSGLYKGTTALLKIISKPLIAALKILAKPCTTALNYYNDYAYSKSKITPPNDRFLTEEYLKGVINRETKGEGTKKLRDAMTVISDNKDKPIDTPLILEALENIASARGKSVEDIKADWVKFQDLLAEQKRIGDANNQEEVPSLNSFHRLNDKMASPSQMRFGEIVGDKLDIDPVFGALLSPTGGLVGPGNTAIDLNDSATGVHGAVHDASGYLYNYHDKGDGYDYLGTDGRDTSDPYSGQRNGIHYWKNHSGVTSEDKDVWAESIMRGITGWEDRNIDQDTGTTKIENFEK